MVVLPTFGSAAQLQSVLRTVPADSVCVQLKLPVGIEPTDSSNIKRKSVHIQTRTNRMLTASPSAASTRRTASSCRFRRSSCQDTASCPSAHKGREFNNAERELRTVI